MPSRKPLTDLFILPFIPPTTSLIGKKRPLDPSAVLLSPSKRRVLEADVFPGPSTPVKKLDFSSALHTHAPSTPKSTNNSLLENSPFTPRPSTSTSTARTKLAPSPEITPQPARRHLTSDESAEKIEAMRILKEKQADNPFLDLAPSAGHHYHPTTPSIDRTSPHYPGFDIPCDSSIPPNTSSMSSSANSTTPVTDALESSKENLPPRKKVKKTLTLPAPTERPKLADGEARSISEPAMKSPLATGFPSLPPPTDIS